MKKIGISLLLVLSMVLSMAVPAFASSSSDYAEKGSTFTVMLMPEADQAEENGDPVSVELVLFCEYEGEEVDEFGFYKFTDTIKYNKNRFELVDGTEWVEDGFEFEVVEEGKILVTAEKVTGLENGASVCYFELQAIDTGSASLKQENVEIRRTSSSTSKYTVTKETLTLKGVKSLSDEDDEYSISTDYDPDYGTVYLSTKSEKPGEEVWFRIVTKSGYEVDEIVVFYEDDDEVCEVKWRSSIDDNGYRYYYFDMPDEEVTIEVDFDGEGVKSTKDHGLKLFYDGDYGFVYLNTYSAEEDTRIKITVEPYDDSYEFTFDVEDAEGNTYEPKLSSNKQYYYFSMPDEDVEISVDFSGTLVSGGTTYGIVDYTDDEYGYVNMPTKAAKGTKVKVMAFPEDGYVVDRVKVTGFESEKKYTASDKGEYYQFTMPEEKVIVEVIFIDEDDLDNEYKVVADVDDDHGSVKLSTTKAQYDEKVKIWVDPDSGYEIDTIELTEDASGDTVELHGDEDDDYYYFYMPRDDVYLYVDFEESSSSSAKTYAVNLSYNKDQGSVELSRSKAPSGKTVSIFVEPEEGYEVDDVKVAKSTSSTTTINVYDDEDEKGETFYYFTMKAYAVKVTVTFKAENGSSYQVAVDSGITNGKVEVSDTSADSGDKVNIEAKPNTGYEVDTVVVTKSNGTKVTVTKNTDGTYTFTMPASKVTVDATFKKAATGYKVNVDSTITNGKIEVSQATANTSTKITVTAKPDTGYEIDTVVVTTSSGAKVTVTKNTDGTYKFTMPAKDVTVDATFKKTASTTTPGVHVCPAKSYADVKATEWYHDAVDYVISKGLMGSTNTNAYTFEPGTIASRGMIVTIIWRLANEPLADAAIPFTDVPAGQWYTEAIRWAAANDILRDVAVSGAFEPNAPLTREQIAAIIYRYEQYQGGGFKGTINIDLSKFKDMDEISPLLVEAIGWCNNEGVLKGDDTTGKLMPKGNVDRAQLAQILMNYIERK